MIISRTPFRISFFGGGTDYPGWFRDNGGAVLATTINRYCYITCRFLPPFFEHKSRIVWSQIERVVDHADIRHPVVRVVLDDMGIKEGIEIHHDGDLPSRSGLGSSSAFTVGLLHALHALKGEWVTKAELARQAIRVEQELLKENVGVQDQIETAHGGLNRIEILPNGGFKVEPVVLARERFEALEQHMLVFYTGVARNATDVAGAQVAAIPDRRRELTEMHRMVDQAIGILTGKGDIGDFGRLLHESWQLKRSLSDKVAPAFVNDIYDRAMKAGALGGKLLGAGGGGFMLFFVRLEDHPKVLAALSELLVVPIELDDSGTQIIFYDRPRYSRTALAGQRYKRYGIDDNGNGGASRG
ncbi:MAG: kinase [Rhodospirillales bacterium]|nr:kinase [Rhodospirillales bacterium]